MEALIGIPFMAGSSDSGEPEKSSPGVAYIDMSRSENTVALNGSYIIDARDLYRPDSKRYWTDRPELEKFNKVVDAIRTVSETGAYYNDVDVNSFRLLIKTAAVRTLRELEFATVQDIIIAGTIPDHWTSKQKINKRWLLSKDEWTEHKKNLLEFAKSLQSL